MIAEHKNFKYHDGPVLVTATIYALFLGKNWRDDGNHVDRMNLLKQFLIDLPGSGFMNVLSQYGCGFGAGNAGCFMQATVDTPDDGRPLFELTDGDLRKKLQSLIDGGAIAQPGTPPNVVAFVFLADNVHINDANDPTLPTDHVTCLSTSAAFGYHDSMTTTNGDLLAYAVVSSANDECVRIVCDRDPASCPLSRQLPQLDRQTLVTSHEFAEMLTNPKRLRGWFDDQDGPDPGDEVADICQRDPGDPVAAGQITVSRTWAVQKIYSATDAAAQRDPAVTSAPNPLPKLPTAPAPRRVALAAIHQLNKGAKILPLPNLHVDAVRDTIGRDARDTRAFLKRLFDPHRPNDLVPDLPALLRHLADVIEEDAHG